MDFINSLESIIWSEHFWLPENISWKDLISNSTMQYPQFKELAYSIGVGVILLVLRLLVETFIYMPIGYAAGFMNKNTKLWVRMYSHLKLGFLDQKGKFRRIAETAWRFTFYSLIWIFGVCVLHDEPQFTNIDECWRNWPNHHITDDVWWYFIIETGFYWALLCSTYLIDIKRSDFWQMMLHHLITIILLSVSWTCNFIRVGSLVLLCHDTADILLELGKLFHYAKWQFSVTIVFMVFLVTWIATRLVYFPVGIIYPMLTDAPEFIQKSYRWENLLQRPIMPRIIFAMLCILLLLHVFWTYLLFKIAYKSTSGGIDDIREESDDDEETSASTQKKVE